MKKVSLVFDIGANLRHGTEIFLKMETNAVAAESQEY